MANKGLLSWLIALSVLLAMLVAIFPLAPAYAGLRPELLCLLVIYWVVHARQYVGLLFAFGVGLLQGLLEGVTWGAHAIGLVLVTYFCLAAHHRLHNYALPHQTFWVFVLVGVHQVMVNWVHGLAGYSAAPLTLAVSAAISALCWPPLVVAIAKVRANYRLL